MNHLLCIKKHRRIGFAWFLFFASLSVFLSGQSFSAVPTTSPAQPPNNLPTIDIPRLDNIEINADPADWRDRGFSAAVFHSASPHRLPADQFDAQVRLAWNERGLLLLADVTDTDLHESDDDLVIGTGASIGFTQTDARGLESWQLTIAPGVDPLYAHMRTSFYDERSKAFRHVKPSVTAAAKKTAQGYIIEALVPWEILAIDARSGSEFGFAFRVNRPGGELPQQLTWSPGTTLPSTKSKPHIRLTDMPSPPVTVATDAVYDRFRRTRLMVATLEVSSGKLAEFKIGDSLVGQVALRSAGRLATAEINLPMPPIGKPYGPATVSIDGGPAIKLSIPNADTLRKASIPELRIVAESSVLTQSCFPDIDFSSPGAAEDLIGDYSLHTTFYDADKHIVSSADHPGRYGAIVEVVPEKGKPFKRYISLFRGPTDLNLRVLPLKAALPVPSKFGIDPAVAGEQVSAMGDFIADEMRNGRRHDSDLAILLAGLSESPPGGGDLPQRLGPVGRDLVWWYNLKKQTGNLVPYKYLVHVPDARPADPPARSPLILFLHGSGERGNNLADVKQHGPPKLLKTEPDWAFRNQFIVVSPQCPAGETWNPLLLRDLLDEVSSKYAVDPDRIYLTGLSMGGFGTWEMAEWFPDRFAAIAPICGGGDTGDVQRIKDLPAWVFHGLRDSSVRIESAYEMVQAMRNIHARIQFTVYPDRGHNSWVNAYDDPKLYEWMLRQRRGKPEQMRSVTADTQPMEQ